MFSDKLLVLFLCISCLVSQSLYPVVILVHGSFSTKSKWWKPEGAFFKELEKNAKILGHAVVPFRWSAEPTEKEIKSAADMLAKTISSYPEEEHIVLIGHSHGGNVINYATQILYNQQNNKENQNINQAAEALLDVTPTTRAAEDSEKELKKIDNTSDTKQKKQYLVDKVYLLGTPVDVHAFAPNMNIVGSVINIFSEGDMVQTVLGLYHRCYPLQERLTNVELLFKSKDKKNIKPGHRKLHDELVARWVMLIPDSLSATKTGHFDFFKYGVNAHMIFDPVGDPEYAINV
jgi:hypothetical protein